MMGWVLEVHEGNNIQRGRAFCRGMAINWGGEWMVVSHAQVVDIQ